MNNNCKILLKSLAVLVSAGFLSAYKPDNFSNSVDMLINQSKLSKNSIVSVSFRDPHTGEVIYQKDANLLLHPASILKSMTTPAILNTLGVNYNLSTGIYKDSKGNIYLKLSGDPMLKSGELSKLVSSFKSKGFNAIKGNLYIDDSTINDIPWGTGWMWDDENNPYMPKYNSYNVDRNTISVKVIPAQINKKPKVEISPYYPVKIINTALTSNVNNLSVERKVWKNQEAVYISGKVSAASVVMLPVGSPENFFKYQLTNAIRKNNIKFSGSYKCSKLPKDSKMISEISHKLIDELKITNKYSDNLAAETLFKIAGAKYTGNQGSTDSGIKAFNNFYSGLGVDVSEISIADASGVSQNDLITANWISFALSKLYKSPIFPSYKTTLAVPSGEGTLHNRLETLKGRLFAKTGTNAGVSSIAGYITDASGCTYAFAIIIQNFKGDSKPAKELENNILQILK